MAELTSKPFMADAFPELKKLRRLPETCDKHPTEHLVAMPGQQPFCQLCAIEAKQAADLDFQRQFFERKKHRLTYEVLDRDSIFDDDDDRQRDFTNYEAKDGSEAAKNKQLARHIAGKYLHADYKANTILTGNAGTGKTHLAVSMLRAVNDHINPSVSCLFVSVTSMMELIKDVFGYRAGDYKYTAEYFTRLLGDANLLVIDDLGSESTYRAAAAEATDFVQKTLFGILNRRHGRTIITTNLTMSEMKRIYNTKILSRMLRGVRAEGNVIKFTDATEDKRGDLF
ncbi:ATP-binding protein [Lacticaseibacillus songhuajiangensis]|uniref:ATP-binding protein n=1 Tax=Lacticaseibacillus songhuajiangensis TaxID=1296539 RepID=UPI001CDD291A|nr:ATP-binding protein [Lacticaseibacillus songhuajiangensis]